MNSLKSKLLLPVARAEKTLELYKESANEIAKEIIKYIKDKKKWNVDFQLGDYEAGIDTITLIPLDDGEEKPCCFDEICNLEMEIRSIFDEVQKDLDKNYLHTGFGIRYTSEALGNTDCKIHK